jgi:hypothetical protein
MEKQTVRPAARLTALQMQGRHLRERAGRDLRVEKLAVEVLTALGEREAIISVTNNALAQHCRP